MTKGRPSSKERKIAFCTSLFALVHFSKKGYAHADIYWHHVGTFTMAGTGDRPGKKFAALCDLGDLDVLAEVDQSG
jgi:hypothetical protein